MDVNGKVLRNWSYGYMGVLDEEGFFYGQQGYENESWGKFTFDDEVVWTKEVDPIHHEIYLGRNNTIFTMTKEAHEYNGRNVEFDVVLEYDKDGNEITRWSTWDHLEHLQTFHKELELDRPASVLLPENHEKNTSIWGAEHDYYHVNAFTEIPANELQKLHPAFKPGNWLITTRHGSMTFIIDENTGKVLWTAIYDQIQGNLEGQHVARMLPNGNVLIFDNGRYRGWSRIVEINTATLEVVNEYKEDKFFTYSQGFYQILPNGNWLITMSESGYVYEIDSQKNTVWEFYLPESTESEEFGLVRSELYRMYKYDKEFIDKLLEENGN